MGRSLTITHVVIQFTTHHKPILDSDKEAWPAVRYCDKPQVTYTYWSAISYAQDAVDSTMHHGLDHCYFKNIACAMHRPIHSPLVHPSHLCHRIFFLSGVRFDSLPVQSSVQALCSRPFSGSHPTITVFGSFFAPSCPHALFCVSFAAILGEFPRCFPHQGQNTVSRRCSVGSVRGKIIHVRCTLGLQM